MSRVIIKAGLLTLFCAALLSGTYATTKSRIADNRSAWEERVLRDLVKTVSESGVQLEKSGNGYRVEVDGQQLARIDQVTTNQGYNGNISMWVASDTGGSILGVRVTSHKETPGIGDFIDTTVSPWIYQFDASHIAENTYELKKDGGDFDGMTGATITSRAVTHAIGDHLQLYNDGESTQ